MEQRKILKRGMEQGNNPGARGKLKKEQGAEKNKKRNREKVEKGASGKKLKGVGRKGVNCERSNEHGPPLTEAHFSPGGH